MASVAPVCRRRFCLESHPARVLLLAGLLFSQIMRCRPSCDCSIGTTGLGANSQSNAERTNAKNDPHQSCGPLENSGSPGWIRTSDIRINSPLRYHCATGELGAPQHDKELYMRSPMSASVILDFFLSWPKLGCKASGRALQVAGCLGGRVTAGHDRGAKEKHAPVVCPFW